MLASGETVPETAIIPFRISDDMLSGEVESVKDDNVLIPVGIDSTDFRTPGRDMSLMAFKFMAFNTSVAGEGTFPEKTLIDDRLGGMAWIGPVGDKEIGLVPVSKEFKTLPSRERVFGCTEVKILPVLELMAAGTTDEKLDVVTAEEGI